MGGRSGVGDVAEQVTQRRFEPRVTERMADREQRVRADPLAGVGQLTRALLAEQQPRPEPGTGMTVGRRSTVPERPGVVQIADRVPARPR